MSSDFLLLGRFLIGKGMGALELERTRAWLRRGLLLRLLPRRRLRAGLQGELVGLEGTVVWIVFVRAVERTVMGRFVCVVFCFVC